jgi:MoxR-like ATPase
LENVLRHRLILSYQAQAQGINANKVIASIAQLVPVP